MNDLWWMTFAGACIALTIASVAFRRLRVSDRRTIAGDDACADLDGWYGTPEHAAYLRAQEVNAAAADEARQDARRRNPLPY